MTQGNDVNGRPIVYPTGNARADYNQAARQFADTVVLTPSTLRIEQTVTTFNQLTFELTATAAQSSVNNIALAVNDAFVAQAMFVGIGRRPTTAGYSAVHVQLHTFPNTLVFTGAAEIIGVDGFWNGRASIQINDIQYATNMDMLRFQRTDSLVEGLAVSTAATVGVTPSSAWQGDEAFARMIPQLVFNGTSRNVVTLNWPTNIDLTPATNFTNTVVLMFRGLLAQNGAQSRL